MKTPHVKQRLLIGILVLSVTASLLLVACVPPPTGSFTLTLAPEEITVVQGGQGSIDVQITRSDGFAGAVQLTLSTAPTGLTATFDANPVSGNSTTLNITAAATLAADRYTISAIGTSGTIERVRTFAVVVTAAAPAADPSGIEVRLDTLFYRDDQPLTVELDFGTLAPSDPSFDVVLASTESEDVEVVTLERVAPGRYTSSAPLTVRELGGDAEPLDDLLEVQPGAMFFAFFFPDKGNPLFGGIEENAIVDFGLFEGGDVSEAPVTIEPDVTLSDDERNPPPGAKPVGTILPDGGQPVQLATEELILYPTDDDQLQRFLNESGGTIIAEQESVGETDDAETVTAYLIAVDPDQATIDLLPQLRILFGEQGELLASKEDALSIYMLALYYQLEGYLVAVNPRLQPQTAPRLTATEAANVTHTMEMVPATGTSAPCIPGDPTRPCVENVPALWSYLALTDRDSERVDVAVLDMGFATNDDFRQPDEGDMVECRVRVTGDIDCAPGIAQGSPTVGNSFFGDRSWHGTGVVATIGAVMNNDFGTAGVAGQVAVPMLYQYNLASYAFELGAGMKQATLDGASCINISAGYPCRVLTNLGPDFFVCSRTGRAKLCAEVVLAASAAAGIVCSIGSLIPIIGGAACAVVVGGLVISVGTCMAALTLFDDLRGPIESGVRFAFNTGVPVVTIAGNALSSDSMPPVIRDFVDLSDQRTERWHIMPAMVPETIVVGAVDGNLDNAHFFGDRVDIWAPISSAYMAPEDVDDIDSPLRRETLGGTSASTPFIAGVIVAMQAVNPSLDRNTPGLGVIPARINIVPRIRAILTDDANTFSNAELVALGYRDQPEERRRLVNPLLAVQAAARAENVLSEFAEPLPDPAAFGYDPDLGFREALLPGGNDDIPAAARPIAFGETRLGAVVTLSPTDNPTLFPTDQDWMTFTMTGDPERAYRIRVQLQYLTAFGRPQIVSDSVRWRFTQGPTEVNDFEDRDEFTAIALSGSDVPFAVFGGVFGDNVYKATLGSPELVQPDVDIVEPTANDQLLVCADDDTEFRATASYPDEPDITVDPTQLGWLVNGAAAGSGESLTRAFSEGTHVVEIRAFDDPLASDSITVTAATCTNFPPSATITTPSGDIVIGDDGFDSGVGLSFAEVALVGTATDPEDGDLSGNALVWTTNRTDYQNAQLGTGESLTVRLYLDNICDGETHVVTLQATDSDGNPSAPVQRRITIRRQIC